jgi:hypothetical protein
MENYLNNLISEKANIDMESMIEVEGESGLNMIPLGCLVESILAASSNEQKAIRNMLVKIDFMNGNVMHYFRHLAQAIAI